MHSLLNDQACEKIRNRPERDCLFTVSLRKNRKRISCRCFCSKRRNFPYFRQENRYFIPHSLLLIPIHTWEQTKGNAQKELQEILASLAPLKETQEQHFKKERQIHSEIVESEKSIEADRISPERKQLLEKGNVMEETYREKRENYNTNANALSTLNTEIKEEHDAFSIQQKSLKNIYTQLCHRRSALNEQHSSAKK